MSNYEDLRGAAANEEIILDDQGIPSVMVKVPLVYLDELGIGSAHTPHPAFIINDKVVPYIYVSKYINVIKNNRAYSIPNQDPANCITFDRAVEVCYNKGAGWHLMTAAEWGVLHNLITAQGLEPRGNTNNGRHHVKTYEHGVLSPQNPTNVYRTLTGTGGKAWEALGVCDIVGDVHKWVVARLVDGEIQIVPNNNAAIHKTDLGANSKAWKAILQDGSLVAPGTNGTLKFDYTGNPANATSGFHITTTVEHKQTDDGAGYGAKDFGTLTAKSGVTIPDILKALALFPNTDKTGRGFIYFRNNGERVLLRGGSYGAGGYAGGGSRRFRRPAFFLLCECGAVFRLCGSCALCVIPAGVCDSIRPISENNEEIKQNAKKFQSDSKTTRTQRRSFDYEENKRNDRIRSRLPI